MSPDLESFTAAYNALSFKSPDQGKKKILMQLNADNGWNLSAKEMRERVALMEHDKENGTNGNTDTKGTALARGDEKAKNGDQDKNSFVEPVSEADTINGQEEVQAREISEENAVDTPPSLPCDALKAQIKYKEESTRTFILYGRGKYDYGVTPNSDMQIMIDICHNRLVNMFKEYNGKIPISAKEFLEETSCRPIEILWGYYEAAAKKAGVSISDAARQFEAEYQPDPRKGIEPDPIKRAARAAKAAKVYRQQKMLLMRIAVKEMPGVVPVDGNGEPIWDENRHGQHVVIVTRIDKATGEEVGDV